MSTVLAGGIRMGYDDVGEGDALVLVHGHPFDRTMWRPQVERFGREGWRVIAPDLRGYGESSIVRGRRGEGSGEAGQGGGRLVDPGRTLLSDFAYDIGGLLDWLGVERFVLGGLSMGGQIVMEMYRLFPGRIRGLVLADTSPVAESEDGKRQRNEMADHLLSAGMSAYATAVLPKMVAPRNIEEQPEVARHVLTMMRNTPPAGAAAALRGRAERPDYVEMLSRIDVPTLAVVGSDDEFTPVEDARLMAERIPDATLAVIDGAAHMPNLERTREFDEKLAGWLLTIADGDG